MPTLFSWHLESHGPAVLAHGIVSGHPKLKIWEGQYVHTSYLVHAEENEDGVLLETMSGRRYQLNPEELSAEVGGPGLPLPDPAALGLAPDFWERCIRARDQAAKREADSFRALASPGTLRLCVVGGGVLSALWRGPDGFVQRIPIHMRVGYLQDSILVTSLLDGKTGRDRVDFRCFPFDCRMEPYRVDMGIDIILVVNKGAQAISVQAFPPGVRGQEILCPAGETTRVTVSHPDETCFQIDLI